MPRPRPCGQLAKPDASLERHRPGVGGHRPRASGRDGLAARRRASLDRDRPIKLMLMKAAISDLRRRTRGRLVRNVGAIARARSNATHAWRRALARVSSSSFKVSRRLSQGENDNCIALPRRELLHRSYLVRGRAHESSGFAAGRSSTSTNTSSSFPMTSGCAGFLKIAHMTLGEYSGSGRPAVSAQAIERFLHSEFDIGKFRDMSHEAGSIASTSPAGDHGRLRQRRLLDIVVTATTRPSDGLYRNRGDGTFEDRTRRRGSPTSSAGSSVIRPILTTTAGSISSSPAGPGSTVRSGRHSCEQRRRRVHRCHPGSRLARPRQLQRGGLGRL